MHIYRIPLMTHTVKYTAQKKTITTFGLCDTHGRKHGAQRLRWHEKGPFDYIK